MQETTGRVIANGLVAHGADTVFAIPGAHMYDFIDALHAVRDRIRTIHPRHEQGAGYMAYGYAKSSGRPGIYSVVPGPGVLNSGAALCTALGANAPVLCITGNIMSDLIGRGRGQLHELPDQLATLRGLTKWSERIDHQSQAAHTVTEAFRRMLSGRPGPVAIEAPWDVFGMRGPATPNHVAEIETPAIDDASIQKAASIIAAAENPLIMVGSGANDAAAEVLELARRLQAPVTAHRSGKGIVAGDSPYAMDLVAAYQYWRNCDVLIGIGSRLELQFMRWRWQPPGLKIVRIDIDPTEMVRLKPDVGIVADAAEATRALSQAVGRSARSREAEFDQVKAAARSAYEAVQPQVHYLDAIRELLPRDGFFVEEICQPGFAARFAFPVYAPRQYVTCGYQDNLGFGFPTALGVKIANPDKAVVSISGDGGFMFGVQELATAAQHGIGVVAVVFNNGAFGNVLRDQMRVYDGRIVGAELQNPDFVRLAQSFGLEARRVSDPAGFKTTLADFIERDAATLIEVKLDPNSETTPWTFLHPAPH